MWHDLFVNACILVTILFTANQIFINRSISHESPMRLKILLGLLGGIATIILIYFSIHITPLISLDFRHICEVLVAIFGGLIPAIITGVIAAGFRFTYMGVSLTSMITSIGIIIGCIGCGILSKLKMKTNAKWIFMLLFVLIVRSIMIYILIESKLDALKSISYLWISTVVVSVPIYFFIQYLITAHNLLQKLKQDSTIDFLTGLTNTRQFDSIFNDRVKYAQEKEEKLSLLIIDIDHFKRVNDTYGHIMGDSVLKELGIILKNASRDEDIVSRIGGEEFAVMLKNLSLQDTVSMAERIRKEVEAFPFTLPNGKKLYITVSVGGAIYPDSISDLKNFKESADIKLYEAKRTGRNKVCV